MTTADTTTEQLPPWLAKLSPECREAVRRNVAQAPPLADEQVERLAALLRTGGGAR
ncbi:hypothetical protein [Mycolicibacterium brisbanense]